VKQWREAVPHVAPPVIGFWASFTPCQNGHERFSLDELENLTPRRYDCQVTVLEPTGQKAAFWQAPIVVVP